MREKEGLNPKEKRLLRPGMGVIWRMKGDHHLLLVLLIIAAWAQTAEQTSRFAVPEYCREDPACNPHPSSPRPNGILFVIGRDQEGETQTVLENVGLWDAVEWKKLIRLSNNSFVQKNLNQMNLEMEVFDLRNELIGTPTLEGICEQLTEASKYRWPIVILSFRPISPFEDTTWTCRNSITDGSVILLTSPVQKNPGTAENLQGQGLGGFEDLVRALGAIAKIQPFDYINRTPGHKDVPGWTTLLEARKVLNKALARDSSPLILDPLCFSTVPSSDQCNLGSARYCEEHLAVPYTIAASRDRSFYIQPNCSELPPSCRDCSLRRVRLVREQNEVPSNDESAENTNLTDQNHTSNDSKNSYRLPRGPLRIPGPKTDCMPRWVLVAVGGGGFLLLVVVVIVVCQVMKRNGEDDDSRSLPPTPPPTPNANPEISTHVEEPAALVPQTPTKPEQLPPSDLTQNEEQDEEMQKERNPASVTAAWYDNPKIGESTESLSRPSITQANKSFTGF